MTDDIVARLRAMQAGYFADPVDPVEAADEIARLRGALEELIVAVDFEAPPIATGNDVRYRARVLMRCANRARAALEGEKADV